MSRGVLHLRLDARASGMVAYLTIDNCSKLNSLDSALMGEFVAVIGSLAARDDLRALVLTGAGDRAFIGGANIPEMAALDRGRAADFIGLVHATCDCLRNLPVPVIARIDGYALGAGLEVALSCDLRVASSRAKFGMPEVRLGLPSVAEAALLPRLVGFGHARELVLLGENIDAETALRWGLIERAVAPEVLDAEVEKFISVLLAAGPQALRQQKALLRAWEELPVDAAIAAGMEAFVRAFESDEPRRLLTWFAERKQRLN
jgi:enoyl-CoA hydratase